MEANNVKAMREALVAINSIDTRGLKCLLWELVEADIFDGGQINKTISAVEKAKSALSKPPRNCDVGSPQEQAERHFAMCLKHGGCASCPRNKKEWSYKDCILDWEQMPYEERGVE